MAGDDAAQRPDARDARSKLVCLTPAAGPVLTQMRSEAEDVVAGIFAGISGGDAARLHGLLDHIKGNLAGMLDDPPAGED